MTRSLMAGQRNASRRVAQATKFSIRLPLVGTIRVPPPDQLAFYGVLGGLAVLELIDWPVALAMGLGSALVSRHLSELEQREDELASRTGSAAAAPAQTTAAPPAKKAPVKKAPAKKAAAKKAPGAKAPAKRTPAKKAPPKRATN